MLQRIVIFITLSFVITSVVASSDINTLNQNIATVKKDIQQSTQKKSQLQSALTQTESSETEINNSLKKVQKKLTKQQAALLKLQAQSAPLQTAKEKNRELLKKQIQRAYILSQQSPMESVLSHDGIQSSQRNLTYFRFLTKAQANAIDNLEKSIQAYQNNQTAIQKQNAKLIALKAQQLQDQENLKKTQAQRMQLIQTIDQQIQSKSARLKQLLANKAQLQRTLASLNATHYAGNQIFSNKPFASQKGKLPWPVIGKIIRHFGAPIEESELTWDGDVISAPQGTPVRAVAGGRVIFAKWLEGYGLLLIINHGNGYMSLYGRNQAINVNVGAVVKAGQTIATVGESGGFPDSALYFSIRHNGKALNPGNWCK